MENQDDLLHFGIRGMHWGVRKSQDSGGGGKAPKAPRGKSVSVDAARFDKATKKVKTRGVSSLSNHELKALNERMNLEQNYAKLTASKSNVEKMKKGHDTVKQILGVGTTAMTVYSLAKSPMVKDISKMLSKSGKSAGPEWLQPMLGG